MKQEEIQQIANTSSKGIATEEMNANSYMTRSKVKISQTSLTGGNHQTHSATTGNNHSERQLNTAKNATCGEIATVGEIATGNSTTETMK